MAHTCPWWSGYFLLMPLRRFAQSPSCAKRRRRSSSIRSDGRTLIATSRPRRGARFRFAATPPLCLP